jgi:endonuclease YncB( thermonuclease family)
VRALTVTLCACALLGAQSLGRVVTVHDGDSLTLEGASGARSEVRLFGIDAPEHHQPWGEQSRAALRELVSGKQVRLEIQDTDQYRRTVARMWLGELDVNAELVRRGDAWVYRKFATDSRLYELEKEARDAKRGLWSLPESQRTPPWKWRHDHRAAAAQGECGGKTSCRQMKDCAEARFYLTHCGARQLDGDGDGVPCSSLCRGGR